MSSLIACVKRMPRLVYAVVDRPWRRFNIDFVTRTIQIRSSSLTKVRRYQITVNYVTLRWIIITDTEILQRDVYGFIL